MKCIQYPDSRSFLSKTEEIFERDEALYGLMHGICKSLVPNPNLFGSTPFFATVEERGKIQAIALMTPPHKLQVASLGERPEEAMESLAFVLDEGAWSVPAVMGEDGAALAFAECWKLATGHTFRSGMGQRLMECREVVVAPTAGGRIRKSTQADNPLLGLWITAFHREAFGQSCTDAKIVAGLGRLQEDEFYIWLDPHPVGVACYSRPTERGVSISFVYTPEEHRRRGYATSLVTVLTSQALAQGKEYCILYTDLANPTSNGIYEKVGYRKIADLVDLEFLPI